MVRGAITFAVLMGFGCQALAEEPKNGKKASGFEVESHLFASSVNVDHQGKCVATDGVKLKSWYVTGFPSRIPAFESCTTISSRTARGAVDIKLTIVDRRGDRLQKIKGVLDLGSDGRATQAIDWDHLEIPRAGTYFMVVHVEGKEIKRFPMKFIKSKKKRQG